jgi:TonB family protein
MKHPTCHSLGCEVLVALTCIASLMPAHALLSDDRSKWLSSAVDAQGARHRGSDYAGLAPWTVDQRRTVAPEYPQAERMRHHEGSGLFRVTLDLSTGSAVKVTVLKSTGFPALDNSATDAFRRWRWKPGKWKEIDLPITFTIAPGGGRLPPGANAIPTRLGKGHFP